MKDAHFDEKTICFSPQTTSQRTHNLRYVQWNANFIIVFIIKKEEENKAREKRTFKIYGVQNRYPNERLPKIRRYTSLKIKLSFL